MSGYEKTIEEIVRYVRERVQECEDSSHFSFAINVCGSTHTGDLNVEIMLDETYKSNVRVTGGTLDSVINEFLRRMNWNKRNAPLCLPNVKTVEAPKQELNDEIPL